MSPAPPQPVAQHTKRRKAQTQFVRPHMVLSLSGSGCGGIDQFVTIARSHVRDARGTGGIADKTTAAVGENPVGAPRMKALKTVHVAIILYSSRCEDVRHLGRPVVRG